MRDFNVCFEICLNQDAIGMHIFFDKDGNILLNTKTNSIISEKSENIEIAYKIFSSDKSALFISQKENSVSDFIPLKQRDVFKYLINESMLMIYSRATQLYQWIYANNFCSITGKKLSSIKSDLSKECDSCKKSYYPKLSPCILVAIVSKDKILLAKHINSPFFTILAGFVEYGETLEECVAREIKEEVGINVKDIRYFSSQTWPFPNQLMMGFIANAVEGNLKVDETELESAGWFNKNELPLIPPGLSLSRRLIDYAINLLP